MTLLHDAKRPLAIMALLSGWDMLQADVPSRERVERATAILVGSGLAEVDSSRGMGLTEQGVQLRRSLSRRSRTILSRSAAGLNADRGIAGGGPTHPGPVQGSRRARIVAPLTSGRCRGRALPAGSPVAKAA